MKRLIRSVAIFTFVMVATVAFSRVEVKATGWDDTTIDITGVNGGSEEEWRAANEAYYGELAAQWAEEEAAQSKASENGYTDEYGVLHYTGPSIPAEEREAIQDQQFYEEYYSKTSQESTSSSGTSSSSSAKSTEPTSSTPEYTEAEIEAAWEESDRTEATCTSEGVITYTNSITGETKTEVISVLSHTEGEPEITKKAGMFSEGTQTISCSACGELISTETLPQTCPLPLSVVIAICAGVIVLIIGIFFFLKRRSARRE